MYFLLNDTDDTLEFGKCGDPRNYFEYRVLRHHKHSFFDCRLLDLFLGRIFQNEKLYIIINKNRFKYALSSFVARAVAVVTPDWFKNLDSVELRPLKILRESRDSLFHNFFLVGRWGSFFFAVLAQDAHEALCDCDIDCGRDDISSNAQVDKPRDCTSGAICVECRENQVPRERSVHRYFSGF